MYKKNDLRTTTKPCETYSEEDNLCDLCYTDGHYHTVGDAREKNLSQHPAAFLPHSCDNWVIGGPEEIKTLIEDLQNALKKLEQ